MIRLGLFVSLFLFVLTACSGVTQNTDSKEQTVVDTSQNYNYLIYGDCLPEVRRVKDLRELSPGFSFIRNISSRIILCDFSRGEEIKIFGKVIKVRGKSVSSGSGLIIFNRLSRKISTDSLANAYSDSNNRFEIHVKKRLLSVEGYGLLPVFIISGEVSFLPEMVIGMIAVVDFEIEEGKFTALIWEYGNDISQIKASIPFQDLLLGTVIPPANDGSAI